MSLEPISGHNINTKYTQFENKRIPFHQQHTKQHQYGFYNPKRLLDDSNTAAPRKYTSQPGLFDTQRDLCYFNTLSVEIVTNIFARLDPISLSIAASVCRYWRVIATDDRCWQDAFEAYFGTLPFKRLQTESWKSEYILRTHLIRKWEAGRGAVLSFNPRVGPIDVMTVDFQSSSMVVASLEQGSAVRCNPTTGKVERHPLLSSPINVHHRPTVIMTDGHRLAWGISGGILSMTTVKHGLVNRQVRYFESAHAGNIKALVFPKANQDVIVSAGTDLIVKVHDIKSASIIMQLTGMLSQPSCLEVVGDRFIVAGTADGSLAVWTLSLREAVKLHQEYQWQLSQPDSAARQNIATSLTIIPSPPFGGSEFPVQFVKHDDKSTTILVGYKGSDKIYRYDLTNGKCTAVFGHTVGTVTCMEWDTALGGPSSLSSSPLAIASKQRPKIAQPTKQYHPSEKMAAATPVSMMRLLVAGDSTGVVHVWDGDAQSPDNSVIQPLRVLTGHKYAVSSLYVDGFKIVSGSDDGWIRVWDPLSETLLTVFGNKLSRRAGMDGNNGELMKVRNIWCSDYQGVATIGNRVKFWDFSPAKQLLAHHSLRLKDKTIAKCPRRLHHDIAQQVEESKANIKQENKARQRLNELTLGLSDEEMLAYAIMLSKEQEAEKTAVLEPRDELTKTNQDINTFNRDDYINVDDADLLNALMASLETENTPPSTSDQIDSASSNAPERNVHPVQNSNEWPAVAPSVVRQQGHQSIWNDTRARIIEPLLAHPPKRATSTGQIQ